MTHPVAASKAELPPASITIGIDVSKDHLDAARHPGGDTVRVANTRKGQTALLRWIGDICKCCFKIPHMCCRKIPQHGYGDQPLR